MTDCASSFDSSSSSSTAATASTATATTAATVHGYSPALPPTLPTTTPTYTPARRRPDAPGAGLWQLRRVDEPDPGVPQGRGGTFHPKTGPGTGRVQGRR